MKTAAWSLLSLALVVSLSAQQPLEGRQRAICISGGDAGGTGINGLAVGWSLSRAHVNVSIAAHLANSGGVGAYAGGTAILTRKLGPQSSSFDEVARKEFELPDNYNGLFTLFEGLDLAPGEFWLVFEGPKDGQTSYANWLMSMPFVMSMNKGTRYLGSTYNYPRHLAAYMPTTLFQQADTRYGYQFVVIGEPVPLLKDEDPGRATLR